MTLHGLKPELVSQLPAPTSFDESIRKWRLEHHLTQAAFARLLGTTRKTVQRWEVGKEQPAGKLHQRLLEIMAGELVDDSRNAIAALDALCERTGWSAPRVAAQLGVHVTAVQRWRSGTRAPRRRTAEQILTLLESLNAKGTKPADGE